MLAGKEFGVAAAAHRIRMLEDDFRTPLFNRRRGVYLTERGRPFHADIERVSDDTLDSVARYHRRRMRNRPRAVCLGCLICVSA